MTIKCTWKYNSQGIIVVVIIIIIIIWMDIFLLSLPSLFFGNGAPYKNVYRKTTVHL